MNAENCVQRGSSVDHLPALAPIEVSPRAVPLREGSNRSDVPRQAARFRITMGRCLRSPRIVTSSSSRTPGWPFTSVTGLAQGGGRGQMRTWLIARLPIRRDAVLIDFDLAWRRPGSYAADARYTMRQAGQAPFGKLPVAEAQASNRQGSVSAQDQAIRHGNAAAQPTAPNRGLMAFPMHQCLNPAQSNWILGRSPSTWVCASRVHHPTEKSGTWPGTSAAVGRALCP